MPATIFNGAKVKALKETLSLNGASDIISSSTDPSVVAVDAPVGSLLLNNSSGKLYKKLDAGSSTNWQEVGAGAGGKNYIAKGAFDTPSTSGWSLTHSTLDATSKLPNQASGSWTAATGTLSITTVGAGSQLSLLPYSLSLVSSAATTAGDMLITDALTLDQEAQASVQTFSFFYKVASGGTNLTLSGTSTNSLAVAIYDVTNGAWIDPAGRYNVVQVSGVAKCAGTFQVPSNCTSVRLAVYFPNASAGAATVYLDDFYLGPQVVQYGAPVTDWESFIPTGTWNTNVTYTGYKRRVGGNLELNLRVLCSAAPNNVQLTFNLPSGLVPDSSKLVLATNKVGYGYTEDAGLTSYVVDVLIANGGTTILPVAINVAGTYAADAGLTGIQPFSFGAGDFVQIFASIPILGWSSSVQMSNDTDTRVVATGVRASATISVTAGNPIIFQAIDFDRTGSYSASTGQFTVPVAGVYEMSAVGFLTVAGTSNIRPYKNGSPTQGGYIVAFNGGAPVSGSYLVDCKAGDVLTFVSDATTTLSTNSVAFVKRLSGPSAIAASETVAASYWLPANQSAGPTTPINFSSKQFDSHGAVTTGAAWRFTAPIAGTYNVSAFAYTTSISLTYNLYKNGVLYTEIAEHLPGAVATGSLLIQLIAGDYVDVRPGTTQTVFGGIFSTFGTKIHIHRIGN